MTSLQDRLVQRLVMIEDRPAVIAAGRTQTFGELWRASGRLARKLVWQGLRSEDRVVIFSANTMAAITAFWAILRAGGAAVQLNPKMGASVQRAVLEECAPALIIASDEHAADARSWLGEGSAVPVWSGEGPDLPADVLDQVDLPTVASDDLAAIVYTSGSTGQPKGVCLTHTNLWTVVGAVIDDLEVTPKDSYLMVVPLHYVHGLMQLLIHHLAGAAVHLAGDFMFPQQIVKQLQASAVTGFSGVPFHFNNLIENSTFLSASLPALRWLTVTGGKLDAERLLQIRRAMPGIAFIIAYGQTECAPRATALAADRIDRKPNSVGAPIRGVRVQILDEAGHELAQGEIGEVVVSGANIMRGYWRQPAASAEVLDAQGRLHTGDIGRFDDEGDLFLLGRRSDMIKSAGERIAPQEIEAVLAMIDGVQEAVVVGMPDAMLGERVEAHLRIEIEPDDAPDPSSLIRRLRASCLAAMPMARAPKRFHLWRTFPRRENGKVDRLRLEAGEGGTAWP